MTVADLRTFLLESGLPAVLWQLPDLTYEPCSADFVTRNWDAWLAARPEELVVWGDDNAGTGRRKRLRPLWSAENHDCDNLALGTMTWAQVGNALKAVKAKQPRGGLAYGTVFYTASPARLENFLISGPHAINWFVDYDNRLTFFEPAMGETVTLTTQERSTAWFGIAS